MKKYIVSSVVLCSAILSGCMTTFSAAYNPSETNGGGLQAKAPAEVKFSQQFLHIKDSNSNLSVRVSGFINHRSDLVCCSGNPGEEEINYESLGIQFAIGNE